MAAEKKAGMIEDTKGFSVLIVEDEAKWRDALERAFKSINWRVRTADRAENALEELRLRKFDLVCLDWELGRPGISALSGLDVLGYISKEMRKKPITVLVSGALERQPDKAVELLHERRPFEQTGVVFTTIGKDELEDFLLLDESEVLEGSSAAGQELKKKLVECRVYAELDRRAPRKPPYAKPLQLDFHGPAIVDRTGFRYTISAGVFEVLKDLLTQDAHGSSHAGSESFGAGKLAHETVARLFGEAQDESPSTSDRQDELVNNFFKYLRRHLGHIGAGADGSDRVVYRSDELHVRLVCAGCDWKPDDPVRNLPPERRSEPLPHLDIDIVGDDAHYKSTHLHGKRFSKEPGSKDY